MKNRLNLYALILFIASLALSLGLDALVEALRRRAADTFIMAPRIWGQLAANLIFVLAMIFLLWFVLVRSQPGRLIFGLYLVAGLLLVLYYPFYLSGLDLTFGLLPRAIRAIILYRGLLSYYSLNTIFLAATGAIGLLR